MMYTIVVLSLYFLLSLKPGSSRESSGCISFESAGKFFTCQILRKRNQSF